jgi:hypothetical protein
MKTKKTNTKDKQWGSFAATASSFLLSSVVYALDCGAANPGCSRLSAGAGTD